MFSFFSFVFCLDGPRVCPSENVAPCVFLQFAFHPSRLRKLGRLAAAGDVSRSNAQLALRKLCSSAKFYPISRINYLGVAFVGNC
jgi:hypothetical protein